MTQIKVQKYDSHKHNELIHCVKDTKGVEHRNDRLPTKGDGLMSHQKINFNIEVTFVIKIN